MRKIIDVHVHIGEDQLRSYSAVEALALMDKNGIQYGIVSPVPAFPVPYGVKSSREQNDKIAATLKKYPDRFVAGLGTIDPRHGDAAVPEVDRIMSMPGMRGLVFSNDKTGLTFDNPTMLQFMDALSQYDHPIVLCYTSQYSVLEAPYMLRKVAEKYPEITFINGSSMKDTTHSNCSRYLSASLDNVYMDIANIHQLMYPVNWAIRDSGIDKILFGSNVPFYKNRCIEIEMVDRSGLTEEERDAIYFGNAVRALQLSI
jgi:predicted TIM-barrel fold metal-dependent hydrolase